MVSFGETGHGSFHLGRVATDKEVRAWDIDVAPDGAGLPVGSGAVDEGAKVYAEQCASCHGATGVEGPMPKLVGGQGTLATDHPVKTIGSHWPYATTVFDYIQRAMPFTSPQSLNPSQVYAVVAWLLFRNGLIGPDVVMNQKTLPKVRMLHRDGFVPDPRPDVNPPKPPSKSTPAPTLGEIDFPISGSRKAQQQFLRGVLLLHSFEYDDAQAAFQKAQQIDQDFAMAYWGEAMTLNHPLWDEQYYDAARQVLARLGSTEEERMAKAPTEREKGYLHAIHALYGEGDKVARDYAYAERMRILSERYPKDHEAATFYALALLGTAQGERDSKVYLQAAEIAESVFRQNPRHPGAVHYMIHAYDDPEHAFLGLRAARTYSQIAPAAPHAQHMPSHIFMALGMWDDVVKANEISWKASEARRKEKGLGVSERSYHTLYWLMYAYLQQGRIEEAKQLLDMVHEDAAQDGSPYIKGSLAAMRGTFIVESEQWDVRGLDEDRSGLRFSGVANEMFAIGLSGVKTQALDQARQALGKLRELINSAEATHSSGQILSARVMKKQLSALLLVVEGNVKQGLALLKEATQLADTIPFDYGPPFPVKPAHELYGEVLLETGRVNSAKAQFNLALARAPKRALSLKGLAASTN
ncbi:c-type cytochrome [Candidatus Nitronereus thalassa]|uniref:C-type cytochrome n=1 Tax=Candidatus Nitronereus thalassa TaxID=3020898 RepID=A0ABU3KC49_9BACT|nr:c-type cytochrome [Candidatus Nitronereus thalassa]MDT7044029.1 c-type cytochrome [Candidatus Nitronereus thalassa]